jgi:hypothetical protein
MDPKQARLFKKVKQGKAVLFIGAGASRGAGAPLGAELAAYIHQEFIPGVPTPAQDLIEVCSKVLDTPGVDRATVEERIERCVGAGGRQSSLPTMTISSRLHTGRNPLGANDAMRTLAETSPDHSPTTWTLSDSSS